MYIKALRGALILPPSAPKQAKRSVQALSYARRIVADVDRMWRRLSIFGLFRAACPVSP